MFSRRFDWVSPRFLDDSVRLNSTGVCRVAYGSPFVRIRGQRHVSIHAPVRGETRNRLHRLEMRDWFQSTPLCGAKRRTRSRSSTPRRGFNPRPCAGRNAQAQRLGNGQRRVSIHAPTRGETILGIIESFRVRSFNPRPCAGRNDRGFTLLGISSSFNPRPCAGRNEQACFDEIRRLTVSIHAPVRGETLRPSLPSLPTYLFQSTPLSEAKRRWRPTSSS